MTHVPAELRKILPEEARIVQLARGAGLSREGMAAVIKFAKTAGDGIAKGQEKRRNTGKAGAIADLILRSGEKDVDESAQSGYYTYGDCCDAYLYPDRVTSADNLLSAQDARDAIWDQADEDTRCYYQQIVYYYQGQYDQANSSFSACCTS